MSQLNELIIENISIWTEAKFKKKTKRGRAKLQDNKLYGVTKLRNLIIDLAIKGKILDQNFKEESASELIKKIQIEKNELSNKGKLKKKEIGNIDKNEKKFHIPKNWEQIKIGDIGKIFSGNSINKNEKKEKYSNLNKGWPFIATKDVGYGRDELNYKNGILIPFDNKKFKIAHKNAVLICSEGGSAGKKIGITKTDICFGNKLIANEIFKGIEPRYILYVYQSQFFFNLFSEKVTGIIPGISINEFLDITISLPPALEQKRIVNKVDELMLLCDQLEYKYQRSNEALKKLLNNFLDILIKSKNSKEFDKNWKNILINFQILFTTEESIDELKKTILHLAVIGKLVSQNKNDESVSILLERINKHKSQRVKKKEIQKQIPITTKTVPNLSIPNSWVFKTLGDISFVTKLAGFEYTKYIKLKDVGDVPVIRAQNVRPFLPELKNLKFIDLKTSKILFRSSLDKQCLLVTFIGSIGDVCLFDKKERWHLAPNVAKVETYADLNLRYLNLFMNSPNGRDEILKFKKSTAQPSLSMGAIRQIWVPLPPAEEQIRILKKVDELFNMCDQLKALIVKNDNNQNQLANILYPDNFS